VAQAATLDWLLAGDPAVRWQTLRDLIAAPPRTVRREQLCVAREGWGQRLLKLQNPDGKWACGLYTPKWTSTTYTLLLLRSFGLTPRNPQAMRACRVLLDAGFWQDGGINFYPRRQQHSETCISSMVLAALCWFGCDDPRVDQLAAHVAAQQMPDGGWNCRSMQGYGSATHGSFHTSISALEALLEYERFRPERSAEARSAQVRGREFFLIHRLYHSHHTGKVAQSAFTRFSFPPRWHFDVLRGLDYFREAGAERDPLLADAIALVESKRHSDDRWLLENPYPGKTFFPLEQRGRPSRWNTLRALRVLQWWKEQ
jgi:hypothetical protein